MKKVLIINGHPDKESFNHVLHKSYKDGALGAGKDVKEIILSDMQFNPNLEFGYRKRMELEPDLLLAWEKIQWAEHIVWIYPTWWASMPALLKGFIDRLFLPGFAFQYQEKSPFPKGLLAGKTSEIITTLDTPVWYYKYVLGASGTKILRTSILAFCGMKNKRITYFATVRNSSEGKRKAWIADVAELGRK